MISLSEDGVLAKLLTADTATWAANLAGYPYTPVLMHGKAMDVNPLLAAI